ncbi:hypothetical protein SAMN05660690_1919 [Geodermatophilus telluris]|uniref:Uncharacterized protein n=1 Tax=Geodermatophilus telluris TaxID=1190417 RepID=A0A1G6MLB7_9ACTN|nr:hypothetical protein [Geodermatophilus telluris]SDC56322.1 hypothetical protein SAMN05660690_1919 [Geodermatophilus telluris]
MSEDDLATVLSNVASDARPATRVKIANSPETRAFLDVGLQLLCDDLLDHRGPDLMDDHDAGTRLFTGLSQARLIERAEHEDAHREHPRMLTVGMFRDRWRYKSRYTEDLIAYLLRPALVEHAIRDVADAARGLPEDLPFTELVRQLVARVMAVTLKDQLWSLQTVVWVALPNHPLVQTFLKVQHEQWIAYWTATYERLARRFDLQLRPEYTWHDVAEVFHATAEGARLRARVTGSAAVLSSGDDVLVGAIHMLVPGLFLNPESTARRS